jgi:hypothetical protein
VARLTPVAAASPSRGLRHRQFAAPITTACLSANINDFALITMLGLWREPI